MTGDTRSTLLQLLLMGDGLHNNDWGDQTNTNLQEIEDAIAATESISVASSLTLSATQSNNAVLNLTGTLASATVVTVPALSKIWLVVNSATMGGYSLTFTTGVSGGATVPVPAGFVGFLYCDGTNIETASTTLGANTVLANLGSGTTGVTYGQLLEALNLNTDDVPSFESLNINNAAGTARQIIIQTNGLSRWLLGAETTGETGGNAGSNFFLDAYSDAGSQIGRVLSVIRSTLAATWGGALTVAGNLTCNQTINAAVVQQGGYTLLPPSAVMAFACLVAPDGWLECDGSAVSRTIYANLFGECGSIYGAGDGSTTFNLPDYRGQFLRGYDHGKGVDTGRGMATYQADGIIDHTHSYNFPGTATANAGTNDVVDLNTTSQVTGAVSSPNGGGTETRPKNWSVMFCIKY